MWMAALRRIPLPPTKRLCAPAHCSQTPLLWRRVVTVRYHHFIITKCMGVASRFTAQPPLPLLRPTSAPMLRLQTAASLRCSAQRCGAQPAAAAVGPLKHSYQMKQIRQPSPPPTTTPSRRTRALVQAMSRRREEGEAARDQMLTRVDRLALPLLRARRRRRHRMWWLSPARPHFHPSHFQQHQPPLVKLAVRLLSPTPVSHHFFRL